MAKSKQAQTSGADQMQALLEKHPITLPDVGDIVEGVVISAANNEIHIDLGGIATGVVRGPELVDESGLYTNLQPGEQVTATVLDIENELGEIELSFREAGHQKAWEELARLFREQEIVDAHILDANKGGLIARTGNVSGFLPVSQLAVEHYPRVEGANKAKILQRLQTYVGQAFKVRIIDVDEKENKLIFSEKAARENEQSAKLSEYKVGNNVTGVVTGVVDFGAFVEFGEGLEGLVHISELAWQRIDNPKDVINVGDTITAQIIAIEGGKISLSMRRLQQDPWKDVAVRYKIGDMVKGKVLKLNPFGAFVELDNDIHGLAHISELSWKKIHSPEEVLKSGEEREFKIVSIEPDHHRLGLSVKQLTPRPGSKEKEEAAEGKEDKEKTEKEAAPTATEPTPAEEPTAATEEKNAEETSTPTEEAAK